MNREPPTTTSVPASAPCRAFTPCPMPSRLARSFSVFYAIDGDEWLLRDGLYGHLWAVVFSTARRPRARMTNTQSAFASRWIPAVRHGGFGAGAGLIVHTWAFTWLREAGWIRSSIPLGSAPASRRASTSTSGGGQALLPRAAKPGGGGAGIGLIWSDGCLRERKGAAPARWANVAACHHDVHAGPRWSPMPRSTAFRAPEAQRAFHVLVVIMLVFGLAATTSPRCSFAAF